MTSSHHDAIAATKKQVAESRRILNQRPTNEQLLNLFKDAVMNENNPNSYDMDRLAAQKIMGWYVGSSPEFLYYDSEAKFTGFKFSSGNGPEPIWQPTWYIGHAFKLLQKLIIHEPELNWNDENKIWCFNFRKYRHPEGFGDSSAAYAITLGCLSVVSQ